MVNNQAWVIVGHYANEADVETKVPKVFLDKDKAKKAFRDYVFYICGYFKVPFEEAAYEEADCKYLYEGTEYSLIIVIRETSVQCTN